MYYLSIVCARRAIHITNPYFVPDAAAIETLVEAKKRGVDVKIMVSGESNVCFYDAVLVGELEQTFLADARLCARVDLGKWQRRGLWAKSQEFAASFLQEQV
jgi:phosphatidylserine/phosphatidylglycerophosphate/cardiolipin synthase-like enzyme